MSGTYNAPDEATPITPLGRRASSVAGSGGGHRIMLCWASWCRRRTGSGSPGHAAAARTGTR